MLKRVSWLIMAGYALVLVMVVALGMFAIAGMNTLRSISHDIYVHPFRVNAASLGATGSIALIRDKMLLIVLSDDPEIIAKLSSELPLLDKEVSDQLDIIKANFLGDMRRVADAERLLKEWQVIRSREIELSTHGKRGEARRLAMQRGTELFIRLDDDLDYVTAFSRQRAVTYMEESEREVIAQVHRIGLVLAILIVVASFIGWYVARRVEIMVRRDETLEEEMLESKHQVRSAAYTRSLIEASLDPLVTISLEGKITDVNRATENATGINRSELIGADFSNYFTEPDKAREGYREVFAKGFVADFPLALRHVDGHVTEVMYSASIYRDETGSVLGVFAAARDVTARNAAEAALRENEALLQATLRILPVGLWIFDAKGKIVYSNDAAQKIWAGAHYVGIDQLVEYKGWHVGSLNPVGPHDWAGARAIEKGETSIEDEIEIECFDGTHKFILDSAVPLRKNDGSIRGAVTINHDITARKQAELEREQYFKFFATSVDLMGIADPNGAFKKVNPAFSKLLGYTEDEILAKPFIEFVHPEDRQSTLDEMKRQLERGFSLDFENRYMCKDGSFRWLSWKANVDRDTGLTYATARDITERNQAELRLRESEQAFRALTENSSPDVIVRYDTEGRRIYVNPEFERVNHLKAQDVLGKTPVELSTELKPKADVFTARLIAAMTSGTADKVDLSWVKDEKRICWFVRVVPEFDTQGKVTSALTIWSDITDRKLAEEHLRELNNDFVTLLENTSDYIYFKDQDGRIRFCSQTLAEVTGNRSWREMIGKHDHEVFPEDTARIYYEEELPIFREGKALLNKTDPFYDAQGKPGWVNTNKWPVFDDDKKTVVGIFGISRDITELKQAEDKIVELNRDLERRVTERTVQLEDANKDLESFSYSVSHDLRTPLRAIDGFSHILIEDYNDKLDDEGKRLLKVVRDNTNRMGQLIDDILQFSRTGRVGLTFAEIDMEKLAREVVEELKLVFVGGAPQFQIEAIPSTTGDRAMMRQVFMNLISNALKFARHITSPTVHVGASIKGNEIIYFVKDNGVGFDMKYSDKLFGVFQRLHSMEEFEGTGIGLAIVKRIITRHGGRVWAEGKVNEGAAIYFALPITEAIHG